MVLLWQILNSNEVKRLIKFSRTLSSSVPVKRLFTYSKQHINLNLTHPLPHPKIFVWLYLSWIFIRISYCMLWFIKQLMCVGLHSHQCCIGTSYEDSLNSLFWIPIFSEIHFLVDHELGVLRPLYHCSYSVTYSCVPSTSHYLLQA